MTSRSRSADPQPLGTVLIANPGADVYGSDLQMLETVSALTETGVHAVVAAPEAGPLVERVVERGGEFAVVPTSVVRRSALSPRGMLGFAGDTMGAVPAMVRTIRRLRPDVIVVNTSTIPAWLVAARLCRVPTVCHIHEAEAADGSLVLKALNAPHFLADRLILISEATRASVVGLYPSLAERAVLVRNGVPDRGTPPVPTPAFPPFALAYAARLSPRKGTHIAIEAARLLTDAGHDVTLEVAGSAYRGYEGYVADLHRQVDAAGLDGAVRFTGYANPVFDVYDGAHVVLAPSLREPFGNAVVEAQLSERPVVASAAMGHLESISDGATGMLVPADDAQAMADAVAALLNDPERAAQIGLEARKRALERFGVERYRSEVLSVIREAAGSR